MKKNILLLVFAIVAISSCSKAKTSNISANRSIDSANAANSTPTLNTNSPLNTNLSNQAAVSETKSEINSEMLKQIEAQQLETADPRKAAKQNNPNANQAPKKSVPPGMQN